jgi:hypothetical protein
MFRSSVLAAIVVVVPKVPRFAGLDQLGAAPAPHLTSLDQR